MIDQDKLKEALAEWLAALGPNLELLPESTQTVVDAARRYLTLLESWPTDEMVEAAAKGLRQHRLGAAKPERWTQLSQAQQNHYRDNARAALVAIRDLLGDRRVIPIWPENGKTVLVVGALTGININDFDDPPLGDNDESRGHDDRP